MQKIEKSAFARRGDDDLRGLELGLGRQGRRFTYPNVPVQGLLKSDHARDFHDDGYAYDDSVRRAAVEGLAENGG